MLKELINLSNELDRRNLRKEADYLDWVMKYAAGAPAPFGHIFVGNNPLGTPVRPTIPPAPKLVGPRPGGPGGMPPHGGYPTPSPGPGPGPGAGGGLLAAETTVAGVAGAALLGLVAGTALVYWWPDFMPGASGQDVKNATDQTMAVATKNVVLNAMRHSLGESFKRRKNSNDNADNMNLGQDREAVRQFFTNGSPNEEALLRAFAMVSKVEWAAWPPKAGKRTDCPPEWWKGPLGEDRSCVDMKKAMEIYNDTVGPFIDVAL